MHIERVPGIALSPSGAVAAYLGDWARVAPAYEYDWRRQESFERRAAYLTGGGYAGDRAAVAAALERYNRALGADEASLENARLLGRPETLAAVTGQQAGILTGPAYSIYKAMTTIRLARQQSQRLGVPVVPVFWIAGEDHDWHEVSWVMVPAGNETRRLALSERFDGERRSVALAPMPASVSDLIDEFAQLMPDTEFKEEVIAHLREAAVGGPALDPEATGGAPSLADWFGRLMAWVFRGTGLVFLNSSDPALRRIEAPFFARALQQQAEVEAACAAGVDRWERELGFACTVEQTPNSLNLFIYIDGERLPLLGEGDRVWVRGRPDLSWSRSELVDLALRSPERFSTNVVLRPVVQSYLLPDLFYVGGPGEISYFGLLRDVYRAMGRQMPVVVPREGFTLVEPPIARILQKHELTLDDAFHRLDDLRQELLEREDRLGIAQAFASFRQDFERRHAELAALVLQLDPGLGQVVEENRRQIEHQINRLEEKAKQQHRKNCETALRQFDRLKANLTPNGLQERAFSILPYLVKYGPDLVRRLVDEVPLEEGWSHRAIYL
ncbi:bacillithiol biosynthesis cysteine-adding enzyme BshC [Symbiobacterium thermophilum]|uniref:Putative cysteine ligase BshC n=1 Tax=Symbiobacterium thermophilum (strain DSM 24528 / JCM 14929 / IAM 14863 / T) TaxID=292459 RepID=BSHC_SYMTH|nr:bacillithiol biosynthesis cysteine-adding enzyme BshC [Symbiobacterium thermophilum]Q67L72.2 RecName: Full=Putative cysteine ligase BshC [Symbiobacterium thermophilum IAM 14863]